MEVALLKALGLTSLFILAIVGGLLPIWVSKRSSTDRILSLGNMFSGGIFLGGGLMHLLPEANEGFEKVAENQEWDDTWHHWPLAFFLAGMGFFSIVIVEESVLWYTQSRADDFDDNVEDEDAFSQQEDRPSRWSEKNGECCLDNLKEEDRKAVAPAMEERDLLSLYYKRRGLARDIVAGMTPRASFAIPCATHGDNGRRRSLVSRRKSQSDLNATLLARHYNSMDASDSYAQSRRASSPASPMVDSQNFVSASPSSSSNSESKKKKTTRKSNVATHQHGGGSHGHGHGHGGDDHDHLNLAAVGTDGIIAYVLVLALSFHSVFEGIAFGTQDSFDESLGIFIAIASHTPLAGFALGISLIKGEAPMKMIYLCIFLFSITVPFGGIMGVTISSVLSGDELDLVSSAFQAFSAGTFLFVALAEIIPKELAVAGDKSLKVFLCILGFIGMSAIKFMDSD